MRFWVTKRYGNKEANKSKWASNHIPAIAICNSSLIHSHFRPTILFSDFVVEINTHTHTTEYIP